MSQPNYIDRMQALQLERIAKLEAHGIKAEKGPFLGHVHLSATMVAKLIKLLERKPK